MSPERFNAQAAYSSTVILDVVTNEPLRYWIHGSQIHGPLRAIAGARLEILEVEREPRHPRLAPRPERGSP